jgi:hypothetical protein
MTQARRGLCDYVTFMQCSGPKPLDIFVFIYFIFANGKLIAPDALITTPERCARYVEQFVYCLRLKGNDAC